MPLVLLAYGAGGVVGTALGGRLADWALFRSLVGTLVSCSCCSRSWPLISPWAPGPVRRGLPGLDRAPRRWPSCLQMRLMETAGEAQMLGAALNHSALNLANALGAWLGGLVIAAGLGYRAPSVVGAGLAAAGLIPLAALRAAPAPHAAPGVGTSRPVRSRRARGAGSRRLTRPGCNAGCNVAGAAPRIPNPDRPGIPGFPAFASRIGGARLVSAARKPGLSGATVRTDSAV